MPLRAGARGLVLSGGRSQFDPASLFKAGDRGYFNDFNTARINMFQDEAMTTSVTGDDQDVRRWYSRAPNSSNYFTGTNPHYYETTASSFPSLRMGNAVTSGIASYANIFNGAAATTYVAAIRWAGTAGSKLLIRHGRSGGSDYEFAVGEFTGDERILLYTHLGSASSGAGLTYPNQDIVVNAEANWAGGSATLRVNGTQVATSSIAAGNLPSADATYIDYGWGAGFPTDTLLYADLIINRLLTSQERADLEAWMRARAGIP